MAGSATIGALRVVLGADTALFESGLKAAQKDLDAFHKRVTQVGAVIGASIGAAAVALGVSLKHAFDRADEMGKMAQRIGIPVEELSKLRLAADLSGVSMESVGVAVGRLSKSMSEIAGGKTNTAANAFKALGISVTDANGKLKSSTQVMEEVAEKFKGFEDGAAKTALAIAIFGRAGAQMIPMLNQGAKGLREAREEAEALGLVIDLKTAKAAEEFNDNLRRLRLVTEGVALKITAELAPALSLLTGKIVDFVKEGNFVKNTAESIINGFFAMAESSAVLGVQFRNVGAELHALAVLAAASAKAMAAFANIRDIAGQVIAVAELKKAWQEWNAVSDSIGAQTEEVAKKFSNLRQRVREALDSFHATPPSGPRPDAPIIATETALDKFIKTQQKAIAADRAEAETVGQVAGAREALKILLQGEAVAKENDIRITARMREQLAFLAGEARNAALQTEGYKLVLENKTPFEQYQLGLRNTEAAMRSVGATTEEIGRAQEKVGEKFGMTWGQIGSNIAGTAGALSNLTGTFAKQNKAMGIASKAFGIAQVIINTQIAITKALATLPPPASYVAVGLAVAQGAASLAAIAAQKFATGGALRLSGMPGGGVDSELIQMRVRPDEQVDVWRPGEGPDPRRGADGGVRNITLNISDRGLREFWASGIEHINSLGSDGYRLKVA